MLMDPMGGIVMTNDGNAILREVMETEIVLFYLLPLYWESIFLNPKGAVYFEKEQLQF